MNAPASRNGHTSYPTVREAAIDALGCGLCVVPPREDGSKAPEGEWKRFQADRPTLDDIHRLYGTKGTPKRSGIGLVCGPVSGGLECFEFDAGGPL